MHLILEIRQYFIVIYEKITQISWFIIILPEWIPPSKTKLSCHFIFLDILLSWHFTQQRSILLLWHKWIFPNGILPPKLFWNNRWYKISLFFWLNPHRCLPYTLTHWPLGDLDAILRLQFSILFYWLVSSDFLMIIHPDECHGTSRMVSQHWFR